MTEKLLTGTLSLNTNKNKQKKLAERHCKILLMVVNEHKSNQKFAKRPGDLLRMGINK